MNDDPPPTILTDVSSASELELLQEVMDRYENIVIILEAPCKEGLMYYNRVLMSGSITNALGLLKYARKYLEHELDKHVRPEH